MEQPPAAHSRGAWPKTSQHRPTQNPAELPTSRRSKDRILRGRPGTRSGPTRTTVRERTGDTGVPPAPQGCRFASLTRHHHGKTKAEPEDDQTRPRRRTLTHPGRDAAGPKETSKQTGQNDQGGAQTPTTDCQHTATAPRHRRETPPEEEEEGKQAKPHPQQGALRRRGPPRD